MKITQPHYEKAYVEGSARQVLVNAFERSSAARAACISHYGQTCSVCGFDFEKTYGRIGKDFIHVHHLKEIASTAKEYEVDPMMYSLNLPTDHRIYADSRPMLFFKAITLSHPAHHDQINLARLANKHQASRP